MQTTPKSLNGHDKNAIWDDNAVSKTAAKTATIGRKKKAKSLDTPRFFDVLPICMGFKRP